MQMETPCYPGISFYEKPAHFVSLPRITHAAAEDGDSWPSCGLDLGLSVFAQPTTWSDRLKLAMKHYVLLSPGEGKVLDDTGRIHR